MAGTTGAGSGPAATWYAEYLRSLKAVEAEEFLDLVLFRPIAFVLTKLLLHTPVTPNHVSVASLVFGVLAGWGFWVGSPVGCTLAALAYFLCNTFDCADGQLARLRGGGTPFGYLVDGCIDYCATLAIFVGIAHGLATHRPLEAHWWVVSTAAGISFGWQCAILDKKRKDWMYWVHKRRLDADEEIVMYRGHLERYRSAGTHRLDRVMILAYLGYYAFWKRFMPKRERPERTQSQIDAWAVCNRPVLRMATWIGPTTQMSLIMVCGALGRLDLFLWGTLTLGNAYALLIFLAQRQATARFERLLRPEADAAPAE